MKSEETLHNYEYIYRLWHNICPELIENLQILLYITLNNFALQKSTKKNQHHSNKPTQFPMGTNQNVKNWPFASSERISI